MKLKDLIPILPQYNDGDDKGLVDHTVEVYYSDNGKEIPLYHMKWTHLYSLMKLNSPLLEQEVDKISIGSHYDNDMKIQIKLNN